MAGCGLIADDLTGALDAGAPFLRAGLRAVLPLTADPGPAAAADVLLLNTESRDAPDAGPAAAAARAAARALRASGVPRVYKKIDSVLRGFPGPELGAVLDVYGGRALVAPAFPAQGRTTLAGVQRLHGRPVERFGGRLAAALGAAAARCDVFDAATDADLAAIARRAGGDAGHPVWCGTAGLAAHVPPAWGLRPAGGGPPALPAVDRVCVVAGTSHPVTVRQVETLLASGWRGHRLDPRPAPDGHPEALPPEAVAARLATALSAGTGAAVSFVGGLSAAETEALAAHPATTPEALLALLGRLGQALRAEAGLGLILTGGETALAVCRAMGGTAIEVVGEALPGVPLGVLHLPGGPVAVATKSGGFGAADALRRTAEALIAGGRPAGPP
ncbi:MAG TPA: four-carbon acid sugar kinase family protein [Chloroflexota bacterium]|nr:four-carbon acid sugar kinase family protein [Chloroflexota bacterium]